MNDLFDNPAVQAGVAPFVVATPLALLLVRTRFLAATVLAGVAVMLHLTIGFSVEPLTSVRKMVVVLFAAGAAALVMEMCGADLTGAIKRTEFGLKFGVPAISDEVKLMIAVEAYKE
ncbi:MAG TPA: hypothetical protein VFR86_04045 [Burkholderiaceae bacterium]|nr:hypothetical protein [Burkholderiaceae bacterium]